MIGTIDQSTPAYYDPVMELFVRKLARLAPLSDSAQREIAGLPFVIRPVERRRPFLARSSSSPSLFFMKSGWAAYYSLRANGSRRITGLLLPGDFCGMNATAGTAFDRSIVALTDCTIGRIEADDLNTARATMPLLDRALWRARAIEDAILRKMLLMSSDSKQAVAHFICELSVRAALAGEGTETRFRMPLTQVEMGDALGVTAVHMNRVLRILREDAIVDRSGDELVILDPPLLRRIAQFERRYLTPWEALE